MKKRMVWFSRGSQQVEDQPEVYKAEERFWWRFTFPQMRRIKV